MKARKVVDYNSLDENKLMKQELMTEVMQQMLPYLDNAQLKQLRQVMEQALYHYEVTGTEVKPEEDDSNLPSLPLMLYVATG